MYPVAKLGLMPFEFGRTEIPDVRVIEPQVFEDDRGFFMETYVQDNFVEAGIEADFIQENHSRSQEDVLRGLHYQKGEHAQAKLVRCTRGKILDVAVDLRRDADTFGDHVAIDLSEENRRMLFIPRGFAHGFLTLSDVAEVQYKVDTEYAPDYEEGIIWDDSEVGIKWPVEEPVLSEKDQNWLTLKEAEDKNIIF